MNAQAYGDARVSALGVAHYLAWIVLFIAPLAFAADYPITGTVTVDGNASNLPAGGEFVGSSYNPASGLMSSGALVFPQATVVVDVNGVPFTVTYQLSQTNTSSGQVWSDGTAGLTPIVAKLEMLSAGLPPVPPQSVEPCVFEPINIELAGTASATGLVLSDPAFTMPTVAPSDCDGQGAAINESLANSMNSMQLNLAGDFTPPADDTIFSDGFETTSM